MELGIFGRFSIEDVSFADKSFPTVIYGIDRKLFAWVDWGLA